MDRGKERGRTQSSPSLNRVCASLMRKHAAIAIIAPLSYLTSASATASVATVNHAQHATTKPRGDASLVNQQLNQQELRRTIEDSVLKGLATGMVAHHEKVERGELRRRPFVTLTYAQSIDGSIAGADKSQVKQQSKWPRVLFRNVDERRVFEGWAAEGIRAGALYSGRVERLTILNSGRSWSAAV